MGTRLLVYDRTRPRGEFWLRSAWATGARIYKSLGRIDAYFGASSWAEALDWLVAQGPDESIDEIQYWGHGKWGKVYIASDILSVTALDRGHALHERMKRLKARLAPDGRSLVWFRTCETFGANAGQAFATGLTDFLDCRAAGHTYVIHALQSGLHGLRPGETPHWSNLEGIARGTALAPLEAYNSAPSAPNTLHFMNGVIPDEFFDHTSTGPLR